MGIREYREFKKQKQNEKIINDFLSSLNVTIEDIKAIKDIKDLKLDIAKLKIQINDLGNVKPVEFSKDDEKNIKEYNEKHTTIEDVIKQFQGQVEEFYPYGKPKA